MMGDLKKRASFARLVNYVNNPKKARLIDSKVIDTISWGITLGIKCLKIFLPTESPEHFAASINSCSRKDRI